MKYYPVIIVLACVLSVFGSTYIGIGNRVPGEYLLGFVQNSTTYTPNPQNHTTQLFFQGTPGNNITFVHVNIFPNYSYLTFPVLGQYYNFWIDITLYNTTQLSANMYVYGFNGTSITGRVRDFIRKPIETPEMITLHNDQNEH